MRPTPYARKTGGKLVRANLVCLVHSLTTDRCPGAAPRAIARWRPCINVVLLRHTSHLVSSLPAEPLVAVYPVSMFTVAVYPFGIHENRLSHHVRFLVADLWFHMQRAWKATLKIYRRRNEGLLHNNNHGALTTLRWWVISD